MSSVFSSSASASLPCSSSSVPNWKYDVFISFRGEETRNSFTSFLHDALRRDNIVTYIDVDDLARGDEISPALMRAIEESMISIVVFSENYANSSWCLDELVHILKCRRQYGQQVVPIFYKVDPSHVRKQQGSYAIAFEQLQKRYKEKVNSWRAALTEAANLAGYLLHDTRAESELVEKIVEHILKKFRWIFPKIPKILKISYDGLHKDEKDAFLDIACFFNGESKAFVERLLDVTTIKYLIDKSLVTIKWKYIKMHDLVQEMGRKVVRESSRGDLGKLSRIWNAKDAYSVLHNNTGTEKIEAIFLDWYGEGGCETQLHLPQDVFRKTFNLRLLRFSNKVFLPEGLDYLPNKLKYLEWMCYPLKSLPKNFNPCNLVVLDMRYSGELEQLWDGVKDLQNLREIRLSSCKNLTQLPDLSRASKLESVTMEECESLKKFPQLPKTMTIFCLSNADIEEVRSSSFDSLSNLSQLEIRKCKRLESFPTKINLKSLWKMDLSGCSKLKIFPEIEELMENLMELNLQGTAIKQLPGSIEKLISLEKLLLDDCKELELLPNTIWKIYHLKELSIVNCSKLKILPRLPTSVKILDAIGCISLEEVLEPRWFDHYVTNLSDYGIKMCWPGHKIPRSFGYQNTKSSLSMKLCLNCFDINCLGIAFCAVVDFSGPIHFYSYELCCQAHCDGAPDGVLCTWRYTYQDEEMRFHGDYVFIGCDKSSHEDFMEKLKEYKANRNSGCTSISINFNFSFEGSGRNLNLEVKQCGVYLLYATEAQRRPGSVCCGVPSNSHD